MFQQSEHDGEEELNLALVILLKLEMSSLYSTTARMNHLSAE